MENLFTNGTFNLSIIGIAALGYVANLLKGIPLYIFQIIQQKYGYKYVTDSSRKASYRALETIINELKPDLIRKHKSGRTSQGVITDIYGNIQFRDELSPGVYTIVKDWTWYTIAKSQETLHAPNVNDNTTFYNIVVNCVGKNAQDFIDKVGERERLLIKDTYYGSSQYLRIANANSDTFWDRENTAPVVKRSMDTIFNKEKDIVMDHLRKWMDNKDIYYKNGLPWKTGILLYGKPGTGKSTLIRAIASELDWNISILNDLYNLRNFVYTKPRTIVLLEEIDRMIPSKKQIDQQAEITGMLSSINPETNTAGDYGPNVIQLMQILDGLGSKDGIIFIATTNNIEKLDQTLIRPGRFDLKLEMNYIEKEYAIQMIEHYGLNPDDFDMTAEEYNPSELQVKIFKKLGIQGDV